MEELIKNNSHEESDTIRESAYNRTLCGKEAYREFLKVMQMMKEVNKSEVTYLSLKCRFINDGTGTLFFFSYTQKIYFISDKTDSIHQIDESRVFLRHFDEI